MNSLSSNDIYDICKNKGLILNGIHLKDDLPNKLNKGFYIINLQSKKSNGNGTHWTVFYFDNKKNLYFDPMGFVPPESVEKRIKPYIYCDNQIQSIDTSSCGFYCIAFISFLSKTKNKDDGFKTFVKLFSINVNMNENVLNNILNKY